MVSFFVSVVWASYCTNDDMPGDYPVL